MVPETVTPFQLLRTRLLLFAIGFGRRMTLGARAAMIDGRRIFLIRHTYVPGWHMPGGGVEPGETFAQSVEREVVEETGHRLTAPAELFGIYLNAEISRRDHVALFVCRNFEKEREFRPNHEIAEAGWFDIDALPEGVGRGTRRRIAEIFEGVDRSDIW